MPWLDQSGRFSWLKALCLMGLLAPAVALLVEAPLGYLQPRPLTQIIHELGLWAVRFLLISLAITPLRRIYLWPRALILRRMIGVTVLAYAATHLTFYIADQSFDLGRVADEIVLRYYLTIGFTALLLLVPLGITSTNAMLKQLGIQRWRRLHSLVYPIAVLALIHFFMQSKLDVTEPTLMAGFFVWLLGYRMIDRSFGRREALATPWLAALAAAAATITACGEALYYRLAIGAPLGRVLEANLTLATGWRPAVIVGLAGLAVYLTAVVRRVQKQSGARTPTSGTRLASSGSGA